MKASPSRFTDSNPKITNLSDEQLHKNLLRLKSKESEIVASIVSHLQEVYRRRLFSHYQCSSLYDYCIRILGYSNGEAHRKVSACRLASRFQGVKESIAKGELSLSNAASVQVFLNQQDKAANLDAAGIPLSPKPNGLQDPDALKPGKYSGSVCFKEEISITEEGESPLAPKEMKGVSLLDPQEIIERVKNKSTRECEIELEKIAREAQLPVSDKRPSKRHMGDHTMLKVYLERESLQLLKSRLGISCEQELLKVLIHEKLKETEPKTNVKPRPRSQPSRKARSLSPAKKAFAFKKAQSQCENCGSKYHLQIDHRLSVALGGGNEAKNLRVLCRPCNQRAAIKQLGPLTMEPFLNGSSIG